MKIGIDAKWFFSGNISGRLFIRNVLPELFSLHPEIEWHVFLNAREKKLDWPYSAQNIKTHYIWAGFNMLSNLLILPAHAKKLGLDTVVFQTFGPKSKHFRSVVFVHDILFRRYPQYFTWKERLYFSPLKWTIPAADRVVTTTKYVQDELMNFDYVSDRQRMDAAPSGVTAVFRPRRFHDEALLQKIRSRYNLPESYILFVGRLNARKNIENLAGSFPFIRDKKICLVIAGEKDWKAARLDKLVNKEDISDRIYFTGAVSDDELSAIYAMARVFCFPSYAEGMGLPPLEAMASGVPVIVSHTTSMPEVCGRAALYIDPSDPRSIAQKINELLADKPLYDKMVSEGLKWSAGFTWRKTARGIMKSIFAARNQNPAATSTQPSQAITCL